jgi:hypothetical protein
MMAAGAQVLRLLVLANWGNSLAKGAANRGKPLSAPAVSFSERRENVYIAAPLGREMSLNMPNWVAVFVASVMLLT